MEIQSNKLAGNATAKELKKFFRSRDIEYWLTHNTVIPVESNTFPPLVFRFDKNYVTVYSKNELRFMYSFFAPTINVLFQKLIKWKLATPRHLNIEHPPAKTLKQIKISL